MKKAYSIWLGQSGFAWHLNGDADIKINVFTQSDLSILAMYSHVQVVFMSDCMFPKSSILNHRKCSYTLHLA